MTLKKITKYDIAISFTERDDLIAKQLAYELKKKGFSVYFYKDENQFGKDLNRITNQVYGTGSNYGLVILSSEYTRKTFTMKEWAALRYANKKRYIKNIFIVKLDERVHLPGSPSSLIYEKWNDNPKEIAEKIREKVMFPPSRWMRYIGRIVVLTMFAIGVYYAIQLKLFQ